MNYIIDIDLENNFTNLCFHFWKLWFEIDIQLFYIQPRLNELM